MQKTVMESGCCGDYEGVVDISLPNPGTYSGGQDLRACCSKFSINRLTMTVETGLPMALPMYIKWVDLKCPLLSDGVPSLNNRCQAASIGTLVKMDSTSNTRHHLLDNGLLFYVESLRKLDSQGMCTVCLQLYWYTDTIIQT